MDYSLRPWSNTRLICLGALMGSLFGFSLLDIDFILGISQYWSEPYGDSAQNVIGLSYFVQDEWRLPIFNVPNLGFPEGANIIFTDSVPLTALLAKIWFQFTGQIFNIMGFWLFFCFVLSGVSMALVMIRLEQKNPIIVGLAIVFAVCAPILLTRLGHAGLMGHFLILFSFAGYLQIINSKGQQPSIAPMIIVAICALLVQAYFFPIVMSFLGAALTQRVFNRQNTLLFAISRFGLGSAVCIIAMIAAGFINLEGGATLKAWGYGHYSMNLLSLFLPLRAHLPDVLSTHITWNGSGLTWDATGGQYEGYAYLGAGVLSMLILSWITARKKIMLTMRQHIVLTCVLIGFFLYAISNKVYLGDILILDITLPEWMGILTGSVRTGGRMFWPFYYVIVPTLIVLIINHYGFRLGSIILAGLVIFQVWDTGPLRKNLTALSTGVAARYLDAPLWASLVDQHQFVMQFPSHQCGGWAPNWPESNAGMELLLFTAKKNIPVNSAYLARHVKDCNAEATTAKETQIEEGGLYIFLNDEDFRKTRMSTDMIKLCRSFNRGIICTRSWDEMKGNPNIASLSTLIPEEIDSTSSEIISFKSGGASQHNKLEGWSDVEPWGTWMIGNEAQVMIPTSLQMQGDLTLIVNSWAFLSGHHKQLKLDIKANNIYVGTWNYHIDNNSIQARSLQIPRSAIAANGNVILSFNTTDSHSPKDVGLSEDIRELAIGIVSIKIDSSKF
jgi:hypothetical protein